MLPSVSRCLLWLALIASGSSGCIGRLLEGSESEKQEVLVKGRWVYTELGNLEDARASLPPNHPELDEPYAKGLPRACLTYEERYQDYYSPLSEPEAFNELLPDATHCVFLRIYYGTHWTDDLVRSTRALLKEAHEAGWHVWLIHQDSLAPDPETNESPVKFSRNVPREFRSLLISFTARQLHKEFPNVHLYKEKSKWRKLDFFWRDYLGPTYIMQRYAGYEFVFVIESDIRYTGSNWGQLFNSFLHIGSESLGAPSVGENEKTLEALPRQEIWQPDFIAFDPRNDLHPSGIESVRENSSWLHPSMLNMGMQIYGMSKRMNQAIIDESKRSNAGYLEEFLPSTAWHSHVNSVIISLGVWLKGHPLHCCVPQIAKMYDDWYTNGHCLASIPLHPIKNDNDTIWGPGISSN